GKCMCKEFEVKSLNNYCFNGVYRRIDKHTDAAQPKQECNDDNQLIREKRESNEYNHAIRKKMSNYPLSTGAETYYYVDLPDQTNAYSFIYDSFPGFTPNEDQSDSSDYYSTDVQSNNEPTSETTSIDEQTEYLQQEILKSVSENPIVNPVQSDYPNQYSTTSQPIFETTSIVGQNLNWQQETYKSTSEDPNDTPFEFTYDEDYQVWFIG
ncbi:unnamed protein product, partial [Meganyctiphanes norvegica]